MSLTPPLRAALQRDASVATTRWSLQSLAALADRSSGGGGDITTSTMAPATSRILLQSVVERLAQQHEFLHTWKQQHEQDAVAAAVAVAVAVASLASSSSSLSTLRHLETLRYVHADTYQLGRRLLENAAFWERFNAPERHTVHATLMEIRARHATTIEKVVDVLGFAAASSRYRHQQQQQQRQHDSAELLLRRRLGIQLLCDHHVELYNHQINHNNNSNQNNNKPHHGAITINAPLGPIVMDAVLEAQHVVDVHLQIYPETRFYFNNSSSGNAAEQHPLTWSSCCSCTVVRPWLHHALVELLKNAMGSTVQQMQRNHETVPAPIDIVVTAPSLSSSQSVAVVVSSEQQQQQQQPNEKMITIDIIDRGTGIAGGHAGLIRAGSLGHSSTEQRWDRLREQQSYATVRSPLSSLGVGLPTSRYMMEHGGGQLTLRNNNNNSSDNNNTSSSNTGGCTARIALPMDATILEREPETPGSGAH